MAYTGLRWPWAVEAVLHGSVAKAAFHSSLVVGHGGHARAHARSDARSDARSGDCSGDRSGDRSGDHRSAEGEAVEE